ncbi:MAG: FkbM family methyltransferase [Aurantibacter sp.]
MAGLELNIKKLAKRCLPKFKKLARFLVEKNILEAEPLPLMDGGSSGGISPFSGTFNKLTRFVVEKKMLETEPLVLLDVGCSGGISPFWRVFEPSFSAVGVDPLVQECKRLNAEEINPNVRYRAAFIGLPKDHHFILKRGNKEPWGGNPWNRLSASAAIDILNPRTREKDKLPILNDWQSSGLTDSKTRIGVEQLMKEENLENLDFIKIDVDGNDIEVILSAEGIARKTSILGFTVEVNFFGSTADTDHTFHNTDRLMRGLGFDLFGLSTSQYSAAALPARFARKGPGKTAFGRPYQGDAVYLRDPMAAESSDAPQSPTLTPHKLLKLACLFECFGLPDHAAELIQGHKQILNSLCDPNDLLNILANEVDSSFGSYSEYIEKFRADPTAFY